MACPASMGPRSLDRGNLVRPDQVGHVLPASMGPRSLDRGNLFYLLILLFFSQCFNGAAIVRSRKYHRAFCYSTRELCFNGAAIVRSRK